MKTDESPAPKTLLCRARDVDLGVVCGGLKMARVHAIEHAVPGIHVVGLSTEMPGNYSCWIRSSADVAHIISPVTLRRMSGSHSDKELYYCNLMPW